MVTEALCVGLAVGVLVGMLVGGLGGWLLGRRGDERAFCEGWKACRRFIYKGEDDD